MLIGGHTLQENIYYWRICLVGLHALLVDILVNQMFYWRSLLCGRHLTDGFFP